MSDEDVELVEGLYPLLRAVYGMTRDEFLTATLDEIALLGEHVPYVVGPGMNEKFGDRPPRKTPQRELEATAKRAGMKLPKAKHE